MALDQRQEQAIRNAVKRAGELRPAAFKLCEGFWACPSHSQPGRGYMLEVQDGRVSCECQGFERMGCCYHAAYVSIEEGLMPHRFLVEPVQDSREAAPIRQGRRGRRDLYGTL